MKARLNLHPTNFTIHLWNREHDPLWPFCRQHTESMAHLLNGCREFHNYYNRRHNRIADKIADEIKQSCPRSRVYSNKMLETVFPEFHDQLVLFPQRKPDILVIDPLLKSCIVVEVTVCFDLYFGYAFDGKCERYEPLCNFLRERNWNIKMVVLDPSGVLRKMFGEEWEPCLLVKLLQRDYWAGVRFQTSLWRITSGGTELRNYSWLSNFFGWLIEHIDTACLIQFCIFLAHA